MALRIGLQGRIFTEHLCLKNYKHRAYLHPELQLYSAYVACEPRACMLVPPGLSPSGRGTRDVPEPALHFWLEGAAVEQQVALNDPRGLAGSQHVQKGALPDVRSGVEGTGVNTLRTPASFHVYAISVPPPAPCPLLVTRWQRLAKPCGQLNTMALSIPCLRPRAPLAQSSCRAG